MKRKGFKGILLLLSMLFALTGCSVSEATQHGMAVDTIQAEDVLLRVDFLNVGQADCALLSTNGHYMVIDGGNNGDADTILSYLEGQGVEKLDAAMIDGLLEAFFSISQHMAQEGQKHCLCWWDKKTDGWNFYNVANAMQLEEGLTLKNRQKPL